ncbi:hypothetical protein [Thermohalobacter berrensis]|uniref:Uncharacterized protein n=1 Tax=Thermohalobacter berrensis TaxID=99594 RepID=A0A419TB31_9FIRM|nr:hypothetical protein [Thermohalobacter berrensis]RKD34686.1 hypothetical protein BET03_02345 [Thermohalobacter berrensis]
MKRKVIVILGIILTVMSIFYLYRPTYGSDKVSINKIISNSDIITQPISIIDVIDFEEYRFAGFVEGGYNLGIAVFKKDNNGNYKCQSIEKKSSNISISKFFMPFFNRGTQSGIRGVDIIVSNNPDFAKVKHVINDKYIYEKEANGVGMVLLEIDIPESEMQGSIYYYDIQGKRLKQ